MKKSLWLVDDDTFELEVHADELRARGFDVKLLDDCEIVMKLVDRDIQKPDLVAVDIMMPTGNLFSSEETDDGRLTGARLIEILEKKLPEAIFVVLSVRADAYKIVPGCKILRKPLLPREFADEITESLFTEGHNG